MLKINYNVCSSAIGASGDNGKVCFAKQGESPTLHSNRFFDYYIGEDNLIYQVVSNGNMQAVYVEEGITAKELELKLESLKSIPVKRMVLKLVDSPSNSNDFLWKNLQSAVGIIDYSEKAKEKIGEILSDANSDANKALEHVKLSVKETNYGFILTDWSYYGSISSKSTIKLLRTLDGQEYLTCPE